MTVFVRGRSFVEELARWRIRRLPPSIGHEGLVEILVDLGEPSLRVRMNGRRQAALRKFFGHRIRAQQCLPDNAHPASAMAGGRWARTGGAAPDQRSISTS